MEILENVLLSNLTTFQTGGPARFLVTVSSEAEIPQAVEFAKTKGLPLIPIGTGSNMLAPDGGVDAVFLSIATHITSFSTDGVSSTCTAEAGVVWDALVEESVEKGFWGLENLSSIPGTVGAAVVQNIGAYGSALSERVTAVDVYDTKQGKMQTLTPLECEFGYRTSIFKKEVDRYIVVRVAFSLTTNPTPNLSYRDLKNYFAHAESAPSIREVREAVIEIRKGKFPPLDVFGTAGSFFLNPIVNDEKTRELSKMYPLMPLFPLPEGGVKLPLAWIFDHALSLKKLRVGKAFLWEKQALVITAERNATSGDVVSLASEVARLVFEKTGIQITPEVRLFGAEKKIVFENN
ncbi:MAG: UDP-N-acetylmuramate dehydrogenase [Candidatus Paceibacterota bacterium]